MTHKVMFNRKYKIIYFLFLTNGTEVLFTAALKKCENRKFIELSVDSDLAIILNEWAVPLIQNFFSGIMKRGRCFEKST